MHGLPQLLFMHFLGNAAARSGGISLKYSNARVRCVSSFENCFATSNLLGFPFFVWSWEGGGGGGGGGGGATSIYSFG